MKFSIRDLMLVTVIVALAVGWWLDWRECERDAQYLLQFAPFSDDPSYDRNSRRLYLKYHPEARKAAEKAKPPSSSAPATTPPSD